MEWKNGRDWLRFEASRGMWCAICHQFRQNPKVMGMGQKRISLALPTKVYIFRNIKSHSEGKYHLAAKAMLNRPQTGLSQSFIQLPSALIPQAKMLFKTVLWMVKHGIAYRKLRSLLDLQRLKLALTDMKFSFDEVRKKLSAHRCHFPAERDCDLQTTSFVSLAQKLTQELKVVFPLHLKRVGRRGTSNPLQNHLLWHQSGLRRFR
eukprot:EG_transcript_29135